MRARKGGFTLVELLIVITIIATMAGTMLIATGSITDNAEAVKIVRDLHVLKLAAVMYFTDNNAWPAPGTSLDAYLDRPFDSTRYDALSITSEDVTTGRSYIGVTLKGSAGSQGVRNKLESSAAESGLTDATGAAYKAGTTPNAVFVIMK